MINQVFILAAGQGLRMRPLTNNTPKPLIEVNGKSMLDRILDKLGKLEAINKVVINGFYLSDNIKRHLVNIKSNIGNIKSNNIIFSEEKEKLETGGGLLKALPLFDKNQPILIINGDIIWQDIAVLEKMINSFDENNTDILVGLKDRDLFLGYDGNGDFNLNQDGQLSQDQINDFVYTGIQIFHPRILQGITLPKGPFSLNYFFKDVKEKSIRLKGIKLPGKFLHIGTADDLKKYENLVDG